MEHLEQEWQHDWKIFVHEVAKLIDAGLDDAAITRQSQNRPVFWTGTIHEKLLNSGLPGIQFDMPGVQVNLKDARVLDAHFLFVSFKAGDVEQWKGFEAGTTIRFATEIMPGSYLFFGIQISDLGDNVVSIFGHLEGVRPC